MPNFSLLLCLEVLEKLLVVGCGGTDQFNVELMYKLNKNIQKLDRLFWVLIWSKIYLLSTNQKSSLCVDQ